MIERFFQILAVILIGVAAFFLWKGNGDAAFAWAVFGSVSFFLNIRFQAKRRVEQRNQEIIEEQRLIEEEEMRRLNEWEETANLNAEVEQINSTELVNRKL